MNNNMNNNMNLFDTEFRYIELLCKENFLNFPDRNLDKVCDIKNIQDILLDTLNKANNYLNTKQFTENDFISETLTEASFFQYNMDISIHKHIRYLPPTLHSQDFIEIAYVLEGECTNYVNNEAYKLSKGDICIISPNTIHALKAFSDNSNIVNITIRKSTFNNTFLGNFSNTDILSDFFTKIFYGSKETSFLLFKTTHDEDLIRLLTELNFELVKSKRFNNKMATLILNQFFITLLRKYEKTVYIPEFKNNGQKENLIFILHYLQIHYSTITLKELSTFFNYSERHIQRLLKEATGLSFNQNIQKLKMHNAAEMLRQTNMTITDISEKVGYSNPSNFRHAFKEFYDTTPSDFKNSFQINI